MMSQIVGNVFSELWWMLLILFGIGLLKAFKPYLKGKFGEFAVQAHVKLYLDDRYILINDVTLPDEQGGTTQIDHIVLSPFGVFVIETKNYKGWIFGGECQKMWTQKIYKKSFKFQNPLHQNYKHVKVLQSVLQDIVDVDYIHSAVVFMPECEFKTAMPSTVFKGKAWVDYIKTFNTEVIPAMKLKRIQLRIEKEVLEKSWKTNREHAAHLKQRHQDG